VNDTATPKVRFQFSLLELIVAVVFLGACTGLWVRQDQYGSLLSLPELWIALLSAALLIGFERARIQAWFCTRSGQLVKTILLSWVLAYLWFALFVVLNAQKVLMADSLGGLLAWPAWLICIVRSTAAIFGLTQSWRNTIVRVLVTVGMVFAQIGLLILALISMIWVHFAAGGNL
jgi:hypothetical protein